MNEKHLMYLLLLTLLYVTVYRKDWAGAAVTAIIVLGWTINFGKILYVG